MILEVTPTQADNLNHALSIARKISKNNKCSMDPVRREAIKQKIRDGMGNHAIVREMKASSHTVNLIWREMLRDGELFA